MAEYIEREALISEFKRLTLGENSLIERIFADGVYAVLETFPAADVVEVVHGEWITEYDEHWEKYRHTCSRCGNDYTSITKHLENYCSNCGAEMNRERRSE